MKASNQNEMFLILYHRRLIGRSLSTMMKTILLAGLLTVACAPAALQVDTSDAGSACTGASCASQCTKDTDCKEGFYCTYKNTCISNGAGDGGDVDGGLQDGGSVSDGGTTTDGGTDTDGGTTIPANSVSGSVAGATFNTVVSSWMLGAPDDPANTTVVYLFSKKVDCSELSPPGWDTRITNGTQFLEVKMMGTAPATYTVTTSLTPAPGEASVNYTLSSRTGTPVETGGTSGKVVLKTLNVSSSGTGTFDLKFGKESISGTFDAPYCPTGNEP